MLERYWWDETPIFIPPENVSLRNEAPVLIVMDYVSNLSPTCEYPELPRTDDVHDWRFQIATCFKQQFKEVFTVPRLNKFHQTLNRITKSHLIRTFLSFLLQLLYHRRDPIVNPFQDWMDYLEKELRFLLTVVVDVEAAGFRINLFEAAANQAGSIVHYLFSSRCPAVEKTGEAISSFRDQTNLLKANLQSSVSIPAAPMTCVVDSIVILNSLVDDLEGLLQREDDPIADVKDQVTLLVQELLLSQSSVEVMTSPQPSEIEELSEPLSRIGGISHRAEYLIASLLVGDAPLWYVANRLTHLGHGIQPLRVELQLIAQKYQFGGGENFSADLPLHDKTVDDDVTVGFADKMTDILDQLVGGASQSMQIVSILGMPGIGKTTLAKKLYNHEYVSYRFDKLAWCVVSQTYKKHSILASILVHINTELPKEKILEMDEISLVEHVHKTLKGRRYLIVLDDIWDSNVLDELLSCFPNDGNGSRILLTSRIKDVAPPNSIMHVLPLLSDEQCWELLEKKVFGSRTCPTQLRGIGKKIATRCCGIPLTVVVIAGILSTVDEEESIWDEVRKSLASYIDGEDNSVMQILELSYKHLPDHLKPCFLYFGEFKEDEEISVGNLKRLWVAEGFIRKEKDKRALDIAENYLMELIDKNLVMITKRRSDGMGAKRCVVHDLLRDLCLKKCKEESFLKYWNDNYLHTIYEKGFRIRVSGDIVNLSYCQRLRSFVGDYPSDLCFVGDMISLRVLHFNRIDESFTTYGIEYLVNLRFLVTGNLPTWIEGLVNLEHLRVKSKETIYLPPEITKMKKLRYIRVEDAKYGNEWNSNQTNNLEYLSKVCIVKVKDEVLKYGD